MGSGPTPFMTKLSLNYYENKYQLDIRYYNPGHNILRHFDVWKTFRITTSERNRSY